MRRLLLRGTAVLLALFVLAVGVAWVVAQGWLGAPSEAGRITEGGPPAALLAERASRQAVARRSMSVRDPRQILFGDLHVHTTFSSDAFLFSLPLIQGEGVHPPADACDFARFCSGLDFWGLTDHAELLTPRQWRESIDSVRACTAASGDPANPDLVSFLGWEWTQMSASPESHYGHKNILLRGLADDEIPRRPIGAGESPLDGLFRSLGPPARALLAWPDFPNVAPYSEFNRWLREAQAMEACQDGGEESPDGCLDSAETPRELFARLDALGLSSLVIPHGTTWGIHAPPGSSFRNQIENGDHDPDRQRLIEVYSGHGSSELYRALNHSEPDGDGGLRCPAPAEGFEPCCWRAGEIAVARCEASSGDDCGAKAELARQRFVDAGLDPRRYQLLPGARPEDWGACGQLTGKDSFLPAYLYRPEMSAQYALALGHFDQAGEPTRFRFGLVGSSDNHKARAGSGYKEFARKAMGDAWGFRQDILDSLTPELPDEDGPVELASLPLTAGLQPERGASFYYTGGLVAVHAEGRNREEIFDALRRREVYGTSGDRILLWFDLLDAARGRIPMGAELEVARAPRFEVRAVGAFEQKPGCPEYARTQLGGERIERLCRSECYHPGDARKQIRAIEVVRIRPQAHPNEEIEPLIQDPWLRFDCPADPSGCRIQFEDPDFLSAQRETLYYVRALQEESPAVGGDALRCERDPSGKCVTTHPCYANGPDFDPGDDCLNPVQERAWSSPIFVRPADAGTN